MHWPFIEPNNVRLGWHCCLLLLKNEPTNMRKQIVAFCSAKKLFDANQFEQQKIMFCLGHAPAFNLISVLISFISSLLHLSLFYLILISHLFLKHMHVPVDCVFTILFSARRALAQSSQSSKTNWNWSGQREVQLHIHELELCHKMHRVREWRQKKPQQQHSIGFSHTQTH